jgi:hypothetical protein
MNEQLMAEQLREWAKKLAEGYDDSHIIAGMLDVADDLEREEAPLNEVIDSFVGRVQDFTQRQKALEELPKEPRYEIGEMEKSFCPTCEKLVKILRPVDFENDRNLPTFFLCDCGYVGQVGVAKLYNGTKGPEEATSFGTHPDGLTIYGKRSSIHVSEVDLPRLEGLLRMTSPMVPLTFPEPKSLQVPDLESYEPCGLWDAEVRRVIDSDDLVFATETDVGRKDPEDESVWTLCWYRLREKRNPLRDFAMKKRAAASADETDQRPKEPEDG